MAGGLVVLVPAVLVALVVLVGSEVMAAWVMEALLVLVGSEVALSGVWHTPTFQCHY